MTKKALTTRKVMQTMADLNIGCTLHEITYKRSIRSAYLPKYTEMIKRLHNDGYSLHSIGNILKRHHTSILHHVKKETVNAK